MLFSSIFMAAMVGVAQAIDVHVVFVGRNPVNNVTANKYWPEKITAAPGSIVQFQFWAGNHTVTQSNFDVPCKPITQTANGTTTAAIKSGFMPVEESADLGLIPIYSVVINDTSPLWFFCGQGPHCVGGMSMVINEKSDGPKTLEAYKTTAAGSAPPSGGDAPPAPGGDAPPAGGDTPPPAGGDTPAPGGDSGSPTGDVPSGTDDTSGTEGDVPSSIPSNPDSIGDDEIPKAGASSITMSWAALVGAAIMFAL